MLPAIARMAAQEARFVAAPEVEKRIVGIEKAPLHASIRNTEH
jgi:hypothetical protein